MAMKDQHATHSDQLLRRHEVEARTAMCRSNIYNKVRDGSFPAPIKIGPRGVRWLASDVDNWLAERVQESQAA